MPCSPPSPWHWARPLLLPRARPRHPTRDTAPCRDFATEYLTCDCNLRWVLPWARNRSAQISDRTLCVYPRHLHAVPLRGARESQLRCGEQGPGARAGGTAGVWGGSSSHLCPPQPPCSGHPGAAHPPPHPVAAPGGFPGRPAALPVHRHLPGQQHPDPLVPQPRARGGGRAHGGHRGGEPHPRLHLHHQVGTREDGGTAGRGVGVPGCRAPWVGHFGTSPLSAAS